MNSEMLPMEFGEQVIYTLRSLYNRYGYSHYKMNKFEEYDLYASNKDFLISDSVITFTDTNGKLMALKPDVTLSIVKNSRDAADTVQKLYYNENVYRVAKGSHGFKEIMQVGLECLGKIDSHCICEVLLLAAESLRSISENGVLNISHLGLLAELLQTVGIPQQKQYRVLECLGEKNMHQMEALCRSIGVSEETIDVLRQLIGLSGTPAAVLPQLRKLLTGVISLSALEQLEQVIAALEEEPVSSMLRIDFSAVDNIRYYNGIVFKGYLPGVPVSVLSGGQYDKLMGEMGRSSGAMGFAVYMDALERFKDSPREYDVDILLLYDESAPLSLVRHQVKALTDAGNCVMLQQAIPNDLKYRQLMKISGSEVTTLGNNA